MRRLGQRPGVRNHFTADRWARDWLKRGPHELTVEERIRRNEIQLFRLVLAKLEPQT